MVTLQNMVLCSSKVFYHDELKISRAIHKIVSCIDFGKGWKALHTYDSCGKNLIGFNVLNLFD